MVSQWSLSCMATRIGPASLQTAAVTVWLMLSRSAGSALHTSATGLTPRNADKPDRDRLRAELIEAGIGLLRHQSGGSQAAQIAMHLGARQTCLRRECFERNPAARLGQCVQYARRDGDRLHAAAIARAPPPDAASRSLHERPSLSRSSILTGRYYAIQYALR